MFTRFQCPRACNSPSILSVELILFNYSLCVLWCAAVLFFDTINS